MAESTRYNAAYNEEREREAVNSILPPEEKANGLRHGTEDSEPRKPPLRCIVDECSDSGDQQSNDRSFCEESTEEVCKERVFKKPRFYQDSGLESECVQTANPHKAQEQEADAVNELPTHNNSSTQNTLCEVVAAHYNNIPEAGLNERSKSRILHLRNFNNWIKSMLINEYVNKVTESKPKGSSLKVLDMGCGKGGDLFKWRQAEITHLVCSDIAATSIEQCKDRYNDMKQQVLRGRNVQPVFSAEFIVANCTKERLREHYQDVTLQLDLVSCQFAFHYCFESLPQAECMMRNATECLRPGGYFFGTCPNANAIISRARKAGGKSYGNDVYSVEFETPLDDSLPPPIFGAKYNFHMEGVVDCPEFLVHFPSFIRLASKYGMEFVGCEPFQNFFDRMKEEEKGRGLLGKMQAMETYPPFPGQSLMGSLSQYGHGDAYLKEHSNSQRLGTLSKDEWEAATLYLIFVFRKEKS